jgi:thiamine biosynthesis lipoprotein
LHSKALQPSNVERRQVVTAHNDQSTHFTAMAGPCVVLIDTDDKILGAEVGEIVKSEVLRIEAKFSRCRPGVVTHINETAGQAIEVDDETADLIGYAMICYTLSEGLIDITSGALRRAWEKDGTTPTQIQVRDALRHVGWERREKVRMRSHGIGDQPAAS